MEGVYYSLSSNWRIFMKLINLFTAIFVVMFCFSFTACSDDENNNPEEGILLDSITGTWRQDWGRDPLTDYTVYHFMSDNEGAYFDKGNGAEQFTYTFDLSEKTVTISYSEYDKEVLPISKLTSSTLVMDGEEYKKAKLTNDMLILGKWLFYVDLQNTPDSQAIVNFQNDGSYKAQDYIYHYNAPNEILGNFTGTYTITDNSISITGDSQIAGEYIIDGLVINGCRFIKKDSPNTHPYLIGGYYER